MTQSTKVEVIVGLNTLAYVCNSQELAEFLSIETNDTKVFSYEQLETLLEDEEFTYLAGDALVQVIHLLIDDYVNTYVESEEDYDAIVKLISMKVTHNDWTTI